MANSPTPLAVVIARAAALIVAMVCVTVLLLSLPDRFIPFALFLAFVLAGFATR